jgi:protein-L-isoaspartate(D-aspartate) O-methyltransferase
MNFEQARFNMIEQQLRPGKVLDPDVLDVLFVVKREEFVPPRIAGWPLPTRRSRSGGGARMFAPIVEALALQALAMKKHENVLEVGTGSGYMAALLGAHADHVWSVEIDPQLAATARENLRRAGVTNVVVETGNGLAGLAAHAPYDVIMVSGAVAEGPGALLDQLKPGGRLFAIEGAAPAMEAVLYTRTVKVSAPSPCSKPWSRPLREAEPAPAFRFLSRCASFPHRSSRNGSPIRSGQARAARCARAVGVRDLPHRRFAFDAHARHSGAPSRARPRPPTSSWSATTAHAASRPACSGTDGFWRHHQPAGRRCRLGAGCRSGHADILFETGSNAETAMKMKTLPLMLAGGLSIGAFRPAPMVPT